jgi:hypothetical protein
LSGPAATGSAAASSSSESVALRLIDGRQDGQDVRWRLGRVRRRLDRGRRRHPGRARTGGARGIGGRQLERRRPARQRPGRGTPHVTTLWGTAPCHPLFASSMPLAAGPAH